MQKPKKEIIDFHITMKRRFGERLDKRIKLLGLNRSEYLRRLIFDDIEKAEKNNQSHL